MTTEDEALYRNVGRLTRQLHDALRELGYDRELGDAVGTLPDARDRLSYVSRLTGEAAEKVLNGVDRTKEELDRLAAGARDAAGALRADPTAALASGALLRYLEEVGASTGRADAHLTDIMLAQDFHDLTGQVIRRIVEIAQSLEGQLLRLLVETGQPDAPAPAPRAAAPAGVPSLQGPAVSPKGRSDVVADQSQVDDLLASLGF